MLDGNGDMQVLCARGAPAFTSFRIRQFENEINQTAVPGLHSLRASYCYFLGIRDPDELNRYLYPVLNLIDSELADLRRLVDGDSILVAPRLGTTSPWSTKASEILHRCGFEAVARIERGVVWQFQSGFDLSAADRHLVESRLHDRMTESVLTDAGQIESMFKPVRRRESPIIDVMAEGIEALRAVNRTMSLALSDGELEYLYDWCVLEARNPTETELMMFSQVNSEHCRHKIFNASWEFDGVGHPHSMFSMIQETHRQNSSGTLIAYRDNAAVIDGRPACQFAPVGPDGQYRYSSEEPAHIVFKAETHNHPTAISPFPGAATGAGGEIRDEGATGIGGKPKAGLCGFSVSHLRIPGYEQPWEAAEIRPSRIASPLQIMLEGPVGGASFNNEFGRPNIGGYFRTFEIEGGEPNHRYGFHKPIMFAGGIGNIRPQHVEKRALNEGDALVVIGGPAMLIGLGGGAASSLGQGSSDENLDFASVQRSNPEMLRRCQETIDRCREMGDMNPIRSIHDVGAGGLSNALPEIVHNAGCGADIRLHDIPVDDAGMTPMEIWCNEAQERYVLAIQQPELDRFGDICNRENCPWQVVGKVVSDRRILLQGDDGDSPTVDVSLNFLLGDIPQPTRRDVSHPQVASPSKLNDPGFSDCVERTLRFPAVADKSFLITIGDRTVSGLVHRDPMIGPWQVPVADAAVTLSGYRTYSGEAMAVGERSPIAVVSKSASVRMAVGEALTNLRSAGIALLSDVKVCANWMAAAGIEGECKALYDAVRSIALNFCTELGISIPVGKDSLSMMTEWYSKEGNGYRVHSPVSLVATAFVPLDDVRMSLTPQLRNDLNTTLFLIDLGTGKNRMGMSALHQTFGHISWPVPDVDDIQVLKNFYNMVGELIENNLVIAYHDRSDGGLFTTLCEMAFAGRVGLDVHIKTEVDSVPFFFNEELGAVVQIENKKADRVGEVFAKYQMASLVQPIGTITESDEIRLTVGGEPVFTSSRTRLHRVWSELSYQMQSIRDNPEDAKQEYDRILDVADPGLSFEQTGLGIAETSSAASDRSAAPSVTTGKRPKVAILREQGVNGHMEMAAAFDRAGFESVDVVMVDLTSGHRTLSEYSGVVMCGGFSFGDVFGAGRGWASLILQHNRLRDMFAVYFGDTSKFALGVCNGCQVMAELKEIIPGAENWPRFARNRSEQFEARLIMTEISSDQSVLTKGMQGCVIPVAVAHGEGRAYFANDAEHLNLIGADNVCMRYVDNRRQVTQLYPFNPNGSEGAIAGVSNRDGRITAMMPHPERVFRMVQYSWAPECDKADSAWMRLFLNARAWLA